MLLYVHYIKIVEIRTYYLVCYFEFFLLIIRMSTVVLQRRSGHLGTFVESPWADTERGGGDRGSDPPDK